MLEEEANVAEIEEDKGDARIWLPNIDGFFIPLVDYSNGSEGESISIFLSSTDVTRVSEGHGYASY